MSVCVPDKSAKSKKRDGGTPDKMSSPVGSAVHIQDEICTGPSIGKVISGDDIDSLAINVDELKKVRVYNFTGLSVRSQLVKDEATITGTSLDINHLIFCKLGMMTPPPPHREPDKVYCISFGFSECALT